MKLVLCPYGHQNAPGVRFCTTCNLPIPPDPGEEGLDDPTPVPVDPPVYPVDPPIIDPVDPLPNDPVGPRPDGIYCPNGHWNPPTQERWCQDCFELLYEPEPDVYSEDIPWRKIVTGVGVVVLVVAGALIIRSFLDDADPVAAVTSSTVSSTTTTTLALPEELPASSIQVSATSEQPNGDNFATNVLDGLPETAWGHCGFECGATSGIGESITFTFDAAYQIESFTIINGYDKRVDDKDRWEQNNRIQTMTVTGDNGQTQTLPLQDVREPTVYALDFTEPTTSIKFTVDSVYEGNFYNDVTISEVTFTFLPTDPES